MTLRGLRLVSIGVIVAMAAFAWYASTRLPAGARLPVHWNAAGEIDRTAPAFAALFMPVGVSAIGSLLFAIIPAIEPLQRQMAQSMPLFRVAWLGLLGMMIVVEIGIALPAFGYVRAGLMPMTAVGLLLVLIGNALPKSRPSFFVGIRTPWTLTDPENWVATHRLGGRTMMLGGLLLMTVPFLPVAVRVPLVFAAIAIAAVPPIVYSWWYWRQHRSA